MNESTAPVVLALDIGGTKTLAALVCDGQVLDERIAPTNSAVSASGWIEDAVVLAESWKGKYSRVSAAVTGLVNKGLWSPLNSKTLRIPAEFPLVNVLGEKFGCAAYAMNDAQAAAWGEYRFGAATDARESQDMVFLTVSTGVGGGVIVGGRLLQGRDGLAGHFGVTNVAQNPGDVPVLLEDTLSGTWMAAEAAHHSNFDVDAKWVFSEAERKADWAMKLVSESAQRLASLCGNIQLMFAPERIVVGGGIGLAPGYLEKVQDFLAFTPNHLRPHLVPAVLGTHAGAIGAADLAAYTPH